MSKDDPPKKSRAQFAYEDEQARLQVKIGSKHTKAVMFDPDGAWAPWLLVAIKALPDVVYENQCAGTGCDHRLIEGFIVPVGGFWLNPSDGTIDIKELIDVFHEGKACAWSWKGTSLPQDRLERLRKLVSSIPYRDCGPEGANGRLSLKLDESRTFEIAEGWIPIETPDGPGVLLYQDCD